uniref:40S ribosomal protein S30 n=1 Tax=Anopheles quadriannulatus TaxID=34691 RepID=A0A182X3P6_ANOQN
MDEFDLMIQERLAAVRLKKTETINDLIKQIFGKEFHRISIWHEGRYVPGTTLLGQFAPSKQVEYMVSLPGGKVHGSLARAGKVRGQTPKVEKKDKPKRKTGRAKRRLQFNKRFTAQTTATAKQQRRRGPNSQTAQR